MAGGTGKDLTIRRAGTPIWHGPGAPAARAWNSAARAPAPLPDERLAFRGKSWQDGREDRRGTPQAVLDPIERNVRMSGGNYVIRLPFRALPVLVLSLSLSAALLGPACAEEEVLFEDRFTEKLADGWTWIKETPDAWRLRDGALEFRVRGRDNELARELPDTGDGPFAVEVTLTSLPQPTRQFEQGGYSWRHENKQAFKYVKELIDGKTYVFPGKKELSTATVQLRIEVRGEKFTALYRPDAKGEYQPAFSGTLPNKGAGKHLIALMCYNGPNDAEHWMRFDDFRIVKLSE
jgi:hypothetical protein